MTSVTQFFMLGMIILTWLDASAAARNTLEAHRHTHELACAVGAVDLCKFHEATE